MTKLITIDYEEYEDLKRYKELFEGNWEVEVVPDHRNIGLYKKVIYCRKLHEFLADDSTSEVILIKQIKDPREGEIW